MEAWMAKTKVASRKRRQNRFSVFLVSLVVLMITAVVWVKRGELEEKLSAKTEEQAQLLEQIEEQEAIAKEIEEYEKYTQTDKFAEEMAKDKLGLVKQNEIFIRPEE
jgi:cell division protein DivIC